MYIVLTCLLNLAPCLVINLALSDKGTPAMQGHFGLEPRVSAEDLYYCRCFTRYIDPYVMI